MIAAADIAGEAGFCSLETTQEIQSAVFAYGPLPPVKCTVEDILKRLGSDKKAVAGEVHFVLPLRIGKVEVSADVPEDVVEEAVKQITGARQSTQVAQAGKDA
jgi:3-dehydroquinate synthase